MTGVTPVGAPELTAGVVDTRGNSPNCAGIHHRSHVPSLFITGHVVNTDISFLIDSGATTNVLAERVFNELPPSFKDLIDEAAASTGSLADGASLRFRGLVTLPCDFGQGNIEITFRVAGIKEDAILGMPFLSRKRCKLDLGSGRLNIQGKEWQCTTGEAHDTSPVQLVRSEEIPAGTERVVPGRLTRKMPPGDVMLEAGTVDMARTLARPEADGRVPLRIMNVTNETVCIPAGRIVGSAETCRVAHITNPSRGRKGSQELAPALTELVDQVSEGECAGGKEPMRALLRQYSDVFSLTDDDLGRTSLATHEIPLRPNTRPIRQPARRLGPVKEAEVDRQVQDLRRRQLIEPTTGPWGSPVVLVRKKDGKWRFCVDYRQLNAATETDAHPLPRIDESLEALNGNKIFSTLDLCSGYWQVPLSEDAQEKAAFVTRDGLWRWKVLPFGLTSAPATFQRLMENVLRGLHWRTLLLYLDDVIVMSPDMDTHLERLEEVFIRFRAAGLKLKPQKCSLLRKQVSYLGHVVSGEGVSTDPEKVKAIEQWETPKCRRQVEAFLGTTGYYRKFVPDFATRAKPLSRLTMKNAGWTWGEEEQGAFDYLRGALVSAPVLRYPDPSRPFILDCDASKTGVGAVLAQTGNDGEAPVAYFSKTLSSEETNYCVTRRELLAVLKAVEHFRPYLYGQQFLVRTDHASLLWLIRRTEPTDQVARWLARLAEFTFTIEHRAGNKHQNADGLSRQECLADCKQCDRLQRKNPGITLGEAKDMVMGVGTSTTTVAPTPESIQEAQRKLGTDTAWCIPFLEQGKIPTREDTQRLPTRAAAVGRIWHALKLDGKGILTYADRVVCPQGWRRRVIEETHRQAHAGWSRTADRIQLDWFWPKMREEIRRRVTTCVHCQRSKPGEARATRVQTGGLRCGRPWQVMALDLVGPLPATAKGNQWLMVIADHFTKWGDAITLPNATTEEILDRLEHSVFMQYGIPERIHTDQGAQFEGSLFQEFCHLRGIDHSTTTPYHPQGNGVVERNNRTLTEALRALLDAEDGEWDEWAARIMRTFRATPHSATGETPNFLFFGRELRLPDNLSARRPPLQCHHEYTQALMDQATTAEAKLTDADWAAPKLPEDRFKEGDWVLAKSHQRTKGRGRKLLVRYRGPIRIRSRPKAGVYELEDRRRSVVNESELKPYHGNSPEEASTEEDMVEEEGLEEKGVDSESDDDWGAPAEISDHSHPVRQSQRTRQPPLRYADYDCSQLTGLGEGDHKVTIHRIGVDTLKQDLECIEPPVRDETCNFAVVDMASKDKKDKKARKERRERSKRQKAETKRRVQEERQSTEERATKPPTTESKEPTVSNSPQPPEPQLNQNPEVLHAPIRASSPLGPEATRGDVSLHANSSDEELDTTDTPIARVSPSKRKGPIRVEAEAAETINAKELTLVDGSKVAAKWLSDKCQEEWQEFLGRGDVRDCTYCPFKATAHRGLKEHMKEHLYVCACHCGYAARDRKRITEHLAGRRLTEPHTSYCARTVYLVDEANWAGWRHRIQLSPEKFPGVRSRLDESSSDSSSTTSSENSSSSDADTSSTTLIEEPPSQSQRVDTPPQVSAPKTQQKSPPVTTLPVPPKMTVTSTTVTPIRYPPTEAPHRTIRPPRKSQAAPVQRQPEGRPPAGPIHQHRSQAGPVQRQPEDKHPGPDITSVAVTFGETRMARIRRRADPSPGQLLPPPERGETTQAPRTKRQRPSSPHRRRVTPPGRRRSISPDRQRSPWRRPGGREDSPRRRKRGHYSPRRSVSPRRRSADRELIRSQQELTRTQADLARAQQQVARETRRQNEIGRGLMAELQHARQAAEALGLSLEAAANAVEAGRAGLRTIRTATEHAQQWVAHMLPSTTQESPAAP